MEALAKVESRAVDCQGAACDGCKQNHRDMKGCFPIYDSEDFKSNPKSALNISALMILDLMRGFNDHIIIK